MKSTIILGKCYLVCYIFEFNKNYIFHLKAGVWTALSQCFAISASSLVTVKEPPAISRDVV